MVYLRNFTGPYVGRVPALLLIAIAVLFGAQRAGDGSPRAGLPRGSKAPPVVFMVLSGALRGLYWIRQGGDFMHGRVLLTRCSAPLAPVAVIPLTAPDGGWPTRGRGTSPRRTLARAGRLGAVGRQLARQARRYPRSPTPGSSTNAGSTPRPPAMPTPDRRGLFSTTRGCGRSLVAIENTPDGALLLPSGNYDVWDVVPQKPPIEPPPRGDAGAVAPPARDPHRVLHQPRYGRDEHRPGHPRHRPDRSGQPVGGAHRALRRTAASADDKNLFPDWAVAEGPWLRSGRGSWSTSTRAGSPAGAASGMPQDGRDAGDDPDPDDPAPVHRQSQPRAWEFTSTDRPRPLGNELLRWGLPEPPPEGRQKRLITASPRRVLNILGCLPRHLRGNAETARGG